MEIDRPGFPTFLNPGPSNSYKIPRKAWDVKDIPGFKLVKSAR